jgi:hypothetical protein
MRFRGCSLWRQSCRPVCLFARSFLRQSTHTQLVGILALAARVLRAPGGCYCASTLLPCLPVHVVTHMRTHRVVEIHEAVAWFLAPAAGSHFLPGWSRTCPDKGRARWLLCDVCAVLLLPSCGAQAHASACTCPRVAHCVALVGPCLLLTHVTTMCECHC